MSIKLSFFWLLLSLLLVGCERPSGAEIVSLSAEGGASVAVATPTLAPTATARPPATATAVAPTPTIPPSPTLTPTPLFSGAPSPPCGQILPLQANAAPPTTTLPANLEAQTAVQEALPAAARPAWSHLLAAPGDVSLVAYPIGDPASGIFHNPEQPMPLASVVKVIHLVAYAEAVAAGTLDPLQAVPLSDLERYYLAGLDLGAHRRAVTALTEEERVFADPPLVSLEAAPRMMIEFSSNAASDYLYQELGGRVIEETAVALDLNQQTAPCPFLGQFLLMGNYTRQSGNDLAAVGALAANPAAYGREVMTLTDAFSRNPDFRQKQSGWYRRSRRPSVRVQYEFSHQLSPQGSAGDYAALMARIATNGLSNSESSFLARRYLEWPMQFPDNQERFTNLGYKNGSLPGIYTAVYYAYPRDGRSPLVVALFYRNLPMRLYRQWRHTLPHDEFARWILYDPEALSLLRAALQPAP